MASFTKIHGLPISKIVRTADSTIIIITNFYLVASCHEIFLRVGGREGLKGLGHSKRRQLPHPLAKILDPPLNRGPACSKSSPALYTATRSKSVTTGLNAPPGGERVYI